MSYKYIQLYSNTKVDYLYYISRTPTAPEIATANAWLYLPAWSDYDKAEIFAPFTSSTISSYISGLTSPLTGWIIYRQKVGSTLLNKVAEVETTVNSVVDYNVANQNEYIYFVFPETIDELGISMVSAPITTCWWDWSVTELFNVSEGVYAPGAVWLFDCNLDSAESSQRLDQTIHNTYSKFPKASVGLSNYKQTGFTALLGSVNSVSGQYSDTTTMKDGWDALVAKGNPVLLKDRKGNIYYGLLQSPTSKFDDKVGSQPNIITISFTELGTPEPLQIFSEV